ncbi:MAG: bifunctional demethylmenaquinone methyltransferase/2-methoxy-6-polyprenyl-1,4-benzoquinol methylase UbiE, partial [Deltaproteobacteria bacterium]|nr:bifunctional demethylmenaquinone methyltransferase/2-methoxy-6-polyprenyl-1,4-benzoquinol methylase UbiE [Deltaproteobacteria bacterium]
MEKKETIYFGNKAIPAEEKKQRVQEIFSSVA